MPATLEWKSGNASKSSEIPGIPKSDNFDLKQEKSWGKDVWLTFSAIAPIARAAATLVSQFLLRRYWEIWCNMALKLLRQTKKSDLVDKIKEVNNNSIFI